MSFPPKKKSEKLYHSEIAQSPNGVELRFTSDVKASKFADGLPYVFVEKRDGTEALLIIENDDIRSVVDHTPQKKWVTVKGEGKGPGAWMAVEDESGPSFPATEKTPTPTQPAAKPQQTGETEASNHWQNLGAEAANVAAFVYSRMEVHGHPLDSAGKASFLSTVFIAMDRRS